MELGITAALPAGNESGTSRREVHDFLPWTFALGSSVDLNPGAPHEFSIAGDLGYALWSDYEDRHGDVPGFGDVLSGAIGVHHRADEVASFLDVSYQPTPVPEQTGRHNYVDNDRVATILGGEYTFPVAGLSFRVGLQAQAQRLLPRHQTKDDSRIVDELPDDAVDSHGDPIPGAVGLQTNNPGWPGFASEGWILGGAATASLVY
jgi:hypothetical protein